MKEVIRASAIFGIENFSTSFVVTTLPSSFGHFTRGDYCTSLGHTL
jgi:hypothetical protein